MSRIKFTVEDSKVSEVLKVLLDSKIDITDWEVNGYESKDTIHIHHPHYNEFTCSCGGKFKRNDEIVYCSYPPKYLFKCDKCGGTRVLSEAEAFGNSISNTENENISLMKGLKDYGAIEDLKVTL